MKIRIFLTTATVLLGMVGSMDAQEASVQIRALLLNPGKSYAPFYVGKVGETMTALELVEGGLSISRKVPVENGRLNLFSSANVDKDDPKSNLAATAKVPEGADSLIVIIVPGSQNNPPFSMVAVGDNPKDFPWGESKALNLTSADFALEIGEHKLLLPGGKVTPVPKVTKADEYNRAQTNFYFKQGQQWVVAAERRMQYVPTVRRLFLIYKTPDALAPDVRTIVDLPPPVFD